MDKNLLKILFNPVGEAEKVTKKANKLTKEKQAIIDMLLKKSKK
jgi:hypothetical protein